MLRGWLDSCCCRRRRLRNNPNRIWKDDAWSNSQSTDAWTVVLDPIYDADENEAVAERIRSIDDDGEERRMLLPPLWSIVVQYATEGAFLRYRRFEISGIVGYYWKTPHANGTVYLPIEGASYVSVFAKLIDIVSEDRPVRHRFPNMLPWPQSAQEFLRKRRIDDDRRLRFMQAECRVIDRFCDSLQATWQQRRGDDS